MNNAQTTLPPTTTVKPLLSAVQNPRINGADHAAVASLNSITELLPGFAHSQHAPAELTAVLIIANAAFRVSIAIDFSPDGGVTWASTSPGAAMGGFPTIGTFAGNPPPDKHGNAETFFGVANNLPPGTNRKARGTLIVDGVALTGSISIILT